MKELKIIDEYNITVDEYFKLFIEASDCNEKFHYLQGDTDIVVSPWISVSDGKQQRVINFASTVPNNTVIKELIGGLIMHVKEIQQYYRNKDALHLNTAIFFTTTISENFSRTEWIITPHNDKCRVVITVKSEYKGRSYKDKGAIEEFIHNTSSTAFDNWRQLCKQSVNDYLVKKNTVKSHDVMIQQQVITTDTSTSTPNVEDNSPTASSEIKHIFIEQDNNNEIVKQNNTIREVEKEKLKEKESEIDYETDEEIDYFDAPDQINVTGNGNLYPLVNMIQNELSQVKSLSTITYSRLCKVESATNAYSHNSTQHNIDAINEKLKQITNRQVELEQQIQEKDKSYSTRFEELERSLPTGKNFSNWKYGGVIVMLLVVWPYFFTHILTIIKPALASIPVFKFFFKVHQK